MARRRKSMWGAFDALSQRLMRNSLKAARKSPGTRLLRAAGKAAVKAGRKATRQAAEEGVQRMTQATRQMMTGVVTPAAALPAAGAGQWLEGHWGAGPLALRKYRLYVPPGLTKARPAPLLILLHGCGQDSASIATSTRVAALARSQGFIALLPEQSSQANPQRCWNWFRAEARVALEATIIMAIADHVCRTQPVQNEAMFAIGISAGGTMALTLALHYPQRFRAVGAHSCAVPHSASNVQQAGQAMRGKLEPDTAALRVMLAGQQPPPLILFHGDQDHVVSPDNAIATVALWLELRPDVLVNGLPEPRPTRSLRRGDRRPALINEWPDRAGPKGPRPAPAVSPAVTRAAAPAVTRPSPLAATRASPRAAARPAASVTTTIRPRPRATTPAPYVRLIRIEGLGHAWSGGTAKQAFSDPTGPDALKLAWQFFQQARPMR